MSEQLSELVHSGQFPLFLLFVAFLTTFIVTRVITRMIRAGRGPFRNNVRGGLHIHHAVPGIVLMAVGGIMSVALDGASPGSEIAAVAIGIGTSLVLDEFALILHLRDVYWTQEGQLSVQVVTLTVAALGLMLLGYMPFGDDTGWLPAHLVVTVGLPVRLAAVVVCVIKGKYSTSLLGTLVPLVALVGAIRLARPGSRWARRFYGTDRLDRARRRATRFDSRFGRWGLSLEDLVAGQPTTAVSADRTAV
ncbi:hypothetical protein GOEFS_059_00410 [Gordonia effusa NBRC 100432]|uniref:Integral membrane protein n=1 Tax=Gordonia effusa NBRC 100432 TaxID=1077974 RepID=H0R0K5_9ACTN|nr:hypothetical protein [Gordonia effusa]GAB18606.1 hypothetical protein GOEFS_059_00410 [Gordonia effusa NBRC 100432]